MDVYNILMKNFKFSFFILIFYKYNYFMFVTEFGNDIFLSFIHIALKDRNEERK